MPERVDALLALPIGDLRQAWSLERRLAALEAGPRAAAPPTGPVPPGPHAHG
jgi:hypothetical protein